MFIQEGPQRDQGYPLPGKVNTGVGATEYADVGEVMGQEFVVGALASQVNIDRGVVQYFDGSEGDRTLETMFIEGVLSVEKTDKSKVGKVKSAKVEVKKDMIDFRLHAAGRKLGT